MKNLSIIDISTILHAVCYRNKETDDFGIHKYELDSSIQSILETTKANEYICFGDKGSFRKQVLKDYKSDRSKERPKFFYDIQKYAEQKWNVISHSKLEADDLVLINYNFYKEVYNTTIVSIDSDLRQQDGYFYNPKHNTFETITKEEACYNLWETVLIGGHNGLKGLTGCGKVIAKKYLSLVKDISNYPYAVLSAYVNGINIDKSISTRTVKGLGQVKGINEFSLNFISTYLLKNMKEVEDNNIHCYSTQEPAIIQIPIKYEQNELL